MWKTFSDRPDWDHQPMRQFVRIEGERVHSDERWLRIIVGTASVERDGPFGYREKDIRRLCEDGDMEYWSALVTHWMPAIYPPCPVAPKNAAADPEHIRNFMEFTQARQCT